DTWNAFPQSERTLWPLWLEGLFPNLAVHTIEYEASKSKWRDGHALGIEERATSLKNYLTTELKPGKRLFGLPLILITHSMGRLIAKAMLRSSSENPNRSPHDLLEQTCGVVFIATPHAGSDLAWWARATGMFSRPTTAVRDMMPNDPQLLKLNAWYRSYAKDYGIRSYAFYETKDTKGFNVVEAASADPAIEGLESTPVDADHIQIAKPLDETAPLYTETVDFLDETLVRHDEAGRAASTHATFRERKVEDDGDWQSHHGYRSERENAFPACADLQVEARQGTDNTKISATASLRCRRERLRGDGGRVFRLSARSVSLVLHADGGDVSTARSLGDEDEDGEFELARGPRNVIAISKRGSSTLEGLALDERLLPEVNATRDDPCSLEVQISAFPEGLNIDVIAADEETRLPRLNELRRKLMKVVVGKTLDRVPVEEARADRIEERLVLSRVYLWPEEPT
ncbi:MAG: hypothetical protein ACR2RE_15665, partial [Geminicoccaceae bacterium]